MAEQAAMRDVLRYVKGRVNGRDRWADGRAGGYAGGKWGTSRVEQTAETGWPIAGFGAMRDEPRYVKGKEAGRYRWWLLKTFFKVPTLILERKIAKSIKVEWQFDGQGPGFPPSTHSGPRVTSVDVSEGK